ncbi:MAG: energy transducer TonB [Bryobacteraceae bacterium]
MLWLGRMAQFDAFQNRSPLRGPVLSFAIHSVCATALFLGGENRAVRRAAPETGRSIPLIAPYLARAGHGGGGGGDRSLLAASRGHLPRAAPRQFTPPVAATVNFEPKLVLEPTLILRPDVVSPSVNLADLGDPFGGSGPKSNGPGAGGGIGDGRNGGVGPGTGPGTGPGSGGERGGGPVSARLLGGRGTPPVLIYKVEPEFSEEARKAKHQGVVILVGEVDTTGRLTNVRVLQGLGLGLDEKAIAAVTRWRFRPGYREGKPIISSATIEVNFHLL